MLVMKHAMWKSGAILAVSLVLSLGAFAASGTVSKSFDFSHAVQINGRQLPPGFYRLKWDGTGPDVQVQFTQGKKVIATAPAKVVPVNSKYDNDAAVVQPDGQGARSLVETRFGGKSYKLVFADQAAQAEQTMKNGSG